MKPGSKDRRHYILVTGSELEELQRFTWDMAEAFGLDRRIENYQGKRPIGFYRWDLDCLVDVTSLALTKEYPTKAGLNYEAMKNLHERLVRLSEEAYAELDNK